MSAENTKGAQGQQRSPLSCPQVPQAWMLGFPQYPQIPMQFPFTPTTISDLRKRQYKHTFDIIRWE